MRSLRLASGSDAILLKQAARLEEAIAGRCDGVSVVALPVEIPEQAAGLLETLGDLLRSGQADAAVCPAGLLSAGIPPGVELGALYEDLPPAYLWVASGCSGPGALPHGASVLTWDDVARAQILYRYPGLVVTSARGWTKVFEGLRHGTWDAACLPPEVVDPGSLWGLECSAIGVDEVMPAIGQGTAAVLVAGGSVDPAIPLLDDAPARKRLRLESIFWWNAMDVPSTVVTAHASLQGGRARVEGIVLEAEGLWMISDGGEAEADHGDFVARDVAQSCLEAAWSRWNRGAAVQAGRAAS